MTLPPQPPEQSRAWLRQAVGFGVAVVCLVWVFHDVRWTELASHMAGIQWGWVAAAVACDILSYVCQAWRWELLLRPLGRFSLLRSAQAIYAGLFINEILPLRVGEVARIYLAARWLSVPVLAILPTIALERFFDGIWLAAGAGVTAMVLPLPRDLQLAADILGGVMLLATAAFVWIVLRRPLPAANPPRSQAGGLLARIGGVLDELAAGIRRLGWTRLSACSFAVSLLFLLLQALAFWLVMVAYRIPLSLWQGFVVLLIVHLGTALPNAPANVGSYQFFVVVGLLLFGVEKTLASGFSLAVFVILTVPLWLLGWLALAGTGMSVHGVLKNAGATAADGDAGRIGA